MHSFHLMQTAVRRDRTALPRRTRDGYTTGADLEMNFRDRMYQLTGSLVGSIVDCPDRPGGPRARTAQAALRHRQPLRVHEDLRRLALGPDHAPPGRQARPERSRLHHRRQPLRGPGLAPARLQRGRRGPEGSSPAPADRCGTTEAGSTPTGPSGIRRIPTRALWSYRRGHDLPDELESSTATWPPGTSGPPTATSTYVPERTDIYATRRVPGQDARGPLLRLPGSHDAYAGVSTDSRKAYTLSLDGEWIRDEAGGRARPATLGLAWVQSSRVDAPGLLLGPFRARRRPSGSATSRTPRERSAG